MHGSSQSVGSTSQDGSSVPIIQRPPSMLMRRRAVGSRRRELTRRGNVSPSLLKLEARCLLSVAGDVLGYHNDISSMGLNDQETQLSPSTLNVDSFGQQFLSE